MKTHPFEVTIDRFCKPSEPITSGVDCRTPKIEGVCAVLFDIYGTLLISGSGEVGSTVESADSQAIHATLVSHGFNPSRLRQIDLSHERLSAAIRERHARARLGGARFPEVDIREVWRGVLEDVCEDSGVECDLSAALVESVALEYECRVNPVWPMPDCRDVLLKLRERGFLLGIVSNAQFYTAAILRRLLPGFPEQLGICPDLQSYSFECGESKPSRAIFQSVVDNLQHEHGISPRETVYIGNDMLNDIWTAHSFGMRTILFAGDLRSLRMRSGHPQCIGLEPDAVIDRLTSIPAILKRKVMA